MKKARTKIIFGVLAFLTLIFLSSPWWIYRAGVNRIYTPETVPYHPVAIVFGAGLTASGTPSDVLKDRLNVAADLYFSDRVDQILVSGDNPVDTYSEPDAMKDYLIQSGVAEADIVADYAGRRTYDTCARAQEIWDLDAAILISQGYHLPRAIFTCRKLGVESVGVSSSLQSYVYQEKYEFREILAIYKAVLDVYLLKPDFIGGEPEDDFN